jgi:nitroreductase
VHRVGAARTDGANGQNWEFMVVKDQRVKEKLAKRYRQGWKVQYGAVLLAARAMGLGASLITLPLWSQTSARRALGLPLSVTPCCTVTLGWPRRHYGPTTRKPVGQVIHLDAYGNRAWLDS